MSILSSFETTPSRVRGVIRYLLDKKNRKEKREVLESVLSPRSLLIKESGNQKSRNMLNKTLKECVGMNLLEESEDSIEIGINPEIAIKSDSHLPEILAKLLLNEDQERNRDFQRLLSWYLSQNFFEAPSNPKEFQRKLKEELGSSLPELLGRERETQSESRIQQFEYWGCYLGFTWHNCYLVNKDGKTQKKSVLLPDPTAYLKQSLDKLFEGYRNQSVPLGKFIHRLGQYCPVFETGSFREEIEEQIGRRKPNYLSNVTSISLRRLEEENLIKLELLGDAIVWVFQDDTVSRFSHISWLDKLSNGENV